MRTNWNTRTSAGDWNSSRIKSRKYLHPTGSFLVSAASHSSTDQDHCSFVYGIWQAQSLWLWDCISYFIKAFFEALGNNKSVLGNKFSSSTFAQHSIYIVNVEVNVCVCVGMGKCMCVYMCVCVEIFNYHWIVKICCLYWGTPENFRRTCDVILVTCCSKNRLTIYMIFVNYV